MKYYSTMKKLEINSLVKKLDINNADEIWPLLKPLGEEILPYFLKYYPKSSRYQSRLAYVYYAMKWGRKNNEAFQLGVMALNDRATLVRYRACGLLAYSLRKDAIPYLRKLLTHKNKPTAEDAKAAIRAIEKQNHNLFIDRDESGKIHWAINREDDQPNF